MEQSGTTSLDIDELDAIFRSSMSVPHGGRLRPGRATTIGPVRAAAPARNGQGPADLAVRAEVPRNRMSGTTFTLRVWEHQSYRRYRIHAAGYGALAAAAQMRKLIENFESAVDRADPTRRRTPELVPGLRAIDRDGRDLGQITEVVATLVTVDGEAHDDQGESITSVFRSDLDLAACYATGAALDGEDDGGAEAAPVSVSGGSNGTMLRTRSTGPAAVNGHADRNGRARSFDSGPWSSRQLREISSRLRDRGIEPRMRDGHLHVSARAVAATQTVIDEVLQGD